MSLGFRSVNLSDGCGLIFAWIALKTNQTRVCEDGVGGVADGVCLACWGGLGVRLQIEIQDVHPREVGWTSLYATMKHSTTKKRMLLGGVNPVHAKGLPSLYWRTFY